MGNRLFLSGINDDFNVLKLTEKRTQFLLAGTSPDGLILRSLDRGKTWSNLGSLGKGNPLAFYQLINGDILYTTDTGWVVNYTQETSTNVSSYSIRAISHYGNVIYVGDDNGDIYYSFNNGISFSPDTFTEYLINSIIAGEDVLIFTVNGIYSLTGETQLVQSGNFTSALDANNGFIYTGTNNGHIWRNTTVNDFTTWTDLGAKTDTDNTITCISLLNNGRIIFGTNQNGSSNFTVYTDDGFNNTTSTVPIRSYCISYKDVGQVFIGSSGDIWKSNDNGESFVDLGQQYSQTSINCLISIS